jgi:hypothetical protein
MGDGTVTPRYTRGVKIGPSRCPAIWRLVQKWSKT